MNRSPFRPRLSQREWLGVVVGVLGGILAVMTCNEPPVQARLRSAQLEVQGSDCLGVGLQLTLPVAWLQDVQLLYQEPPTTSGCQHISTFPENRQQGTRESPEFGTIHIMLDRTAPPYLFVRGRTVANRATAVLLSFREERQTRALFDALRAEFEFRVRAPASAP